MPAMVDPSIGLESFQAAFRQGILECQKGSLDPTVLVHMDTPEGTLRLTYVRVSPTRKIQAMAVFTAVEPIDGLPAFQVGYAVPQALRGRGLAKGIVEDAIAELKVGMGRNGLRAFFVEAIVGADNVASVKVAEATLSKEGKPTTDGHSGAAAVQYVRKVE